MGTQNMIEFKEQFFKQKLTKSHFESAYKQYPPSVIHPALSHFQPLHKYS